jgi:hypothetical protein
MPDTERLELAMETINNRSRKNYNLDDNSRKFLMSLAIKHNLKNVKNVALFQFKNSRKANEHYLINRQCCTIGMQRNEGLGVVWERGVERGLACLLSKGPETRSLREVRKSRMKGLGKGTQTISCVATLKQPNFDPRI